MSKGKPLAWLTIGLLTVGLGASTVATVTSASKNETLQTQVTRATAKTIELEQELEDKKLELAQVLENMQGVVAELDTTQARYDDLQATYNADMEVVVAAEAGTGVLECQLERMTNAANAELQAFEYIMSAWSASDAGNESSTQDLIDRASTAADEAVDWRDLSPCNV